MISSELDCFYMLRRDLNDTVNKSEHMNCSFNQIDYNIQKWFDPFMLVIIKVYTFINIKLLMKLCG